MQAFGTKKERRLSTALVAALVLTSGVAAVLFTFTSARASGGDPTSALFYLNGLGSPDSANCGTATAPVLGSLESTIPPTGNVGSPTSSGEFCTSTSGVYGGPTLTISSVEVTLFLESSSAPPVSLNLTTLNAEPSGTNLALAGYSSTPSWSNPSACVSQTYSLNPQSGAQLSAGDLSVAFFFVLQGTPSVAESPQVCTGGSWPSFVNITGTPQTTSTTVTTTTTTVTSISPTTVISASVSTFTTTLASTLTETATETFTTTVTTGTVSQQPSNGPMFLTLISTSDSFKLLNAAILGTSLDGSRFVVQGVCAGKLFNFMEITFQGKSVISDYTVTGNATANSGIPEDHLIITFQSFLDQQSSGGCKNPGTPRYYLDLTPAGINGPAINKWFEVKSFSWGYPVTEP